MRLAWFHGNLLHTHSGGTRFVIDYSIGLKERFGHDVTVFCDCASAAVRSQLEAAGVPVVETDRFSTNHPLYWLTLPLRNRRKRKQLAYVEREFDCLVNSLFPMNLLVADFRIPKIQMCYEPFAFFYDPGFLKNFTLAQQAFFRAMKVLYSRADKLAVSKMDRILTVNRTNLPKIKSIYKRVATPVYAGIDPRVYHRASDAEIEQLRAKHPGKPLLFHSTDLTGIKGTFPLLDVVKKLTRHCPGIKVLLTVYLDLPEGIRMLQKRIAELGLGSNVEYLGCLPKAALPLYYSAVDFVCQPSLNQPANWPLKEAQLCGTPIIGGVECEEVDAHNGAKINVLNADESVRILLDLFAKDRAGFSIDEAELLRLYSIDSCLAQFNEVVTTA